MTVGIASAAIAACCGKTATEKGRDFPKGKIEVQIPSNGGDEYASAAKMCRKEAEQGVPLAQYTLGLLYLEGKGVPQDKAEAIKWFRKAAKQGHAEAKEELKKLEK